MNITIEDTGLRAATNPDWPPLLESGDAACEANGTTYSLARLKTAMREQSESSESGSDCIVEITGDVSDVPLRLTWTIRTTFADLGVGASLGSWGHSGNNW